MRVSDAPVAPSSLKWLTSLGLITVLFGVGGFLLWSIMTPLNSAVVTQGVLKVSSEKKQVQHLEGGIVKSIFVCVKAT